MSLTTICLYGGVYIVFIQLYNFLKVYEFVCFLCRLTVNTRATPIKLALLIKYQIRSEFEFMRSARTRSSASSYSGLLWLSNWNPLFRAPWRAFISTSHDFTIESTLFMFFKTPSLTRPLIFRLNFGLYIFFFSLFFSHCPRCHLGALLWAHFFAFCVILLWHMVNAEFIACHAY